MVHYVCDDPYDDGFYILCSRLYDDTLELEHSHRDEIFIDFERQVEPGIIKIFNMKIYQQVVDGNENIKKINMTFVGMRDDEFTFDRCIYKETKMPNLDLNKFFSPWKFE